MTFDLIIAMVAAIAAVTAVGFIAYVRSVRDRPALPRTGRRDRRPFDCHSRRHRPGPSACSMVRRLTRRPTAGEADTIIPPTALTADEVAYRIGVAGAPVPPPGSEAFVPPPATGAAAAAAAARAASASQTGLLIGDPAAMTPVVSTLGPRVPGAVPGAPDGAASPRVRLVRDAAVALIGLVVVGLVVLNFFPQGSPVAPPSSTQFVAAVEESPTPEPTAKPTATQAAAVATASPTPRRPACHGHPGANAETDTQADQSRAALHPEADCAPDGGAHATANAETDAEAHRETDPQAEADRLLLLLAGRAVAQLRWIDVVVRLDVRVDLRGRRVRLRRQSSGPPLHSGWHLPGEADRHEFVRVGLGHPELHGAVTSRVLHVKVIDVPC